MADVRLERTEPQRFLAVPAVGREQGLRLDRVTERGAGSVGLDGVDVVGREPGVGERLQDHPLLRQPVGRGEAVGRAVLVDRTAADHGEHRVSQPPGVGKAFDHEHADTLGPAGAVGRRREGLAPPVGGQPALPAELDVLRGRRHHGRAAHERGRALPLPQGLHREVQRDKRRRTHGVDRDGGAFEPEGVGQPSRGDRHRPTGELVSLDLVRGRAAVHVGAVALIAGADEHTDLAAAHGRGIDARALERLPRQFEQLPLLRVHRQRLARGDAEERGIEQPRAVEEATLTRVHGAGTLGIGVVELVDRPSAVVRDLTNRVPALGEQLPQLLRRVDATGVAAAHRDDRDGVAATLLQLLDAPACRSEIGGGALEVVAKLVFVVLRQRQLLLAVWWFAVRGVTGCRARCRAARTTRRPWPRPTRRRRSWSSRRRRRPRSSGPAGRAGVP